MPGPLFVKAVHISQAKIGPGGPFFTPDQLSRDSPRQRSCAEGPICVGLPRPYLAQPYSQQSGYGVK